MNPRLISFIAWEAVRALRRVNQVAKTEPMPFWYDVEDPDVQAAFQDAVAAGKKPKGMTPEEAKLISAISAALA